MRETLTDVMYRLPENRSKYFVLIGSGVNKLTSCFLFLLTNKEDSDNGLYKMVFSP